MNVINTSNISKTYDLGPTSVEALKNISFEVSKGEFISIMGPSGSGKSTLLNAISNQKVSITDNSPNTTRDYVSFTINIESLSIEIIDLPGFINTPDEYLKIFQDNLDNNLERSDIIFLVIDSKNPNLYDFDNLVNKVRKYSKKIWLIINKVDDFENIQVNDSIYKKT